VTGVEEITARRTGRSVSVFPNPARSGSPLTVRLPSSDPDASIELYNILGQRIGAEHAEISRTAGGATVGTGSLGAGVYLLRVRGKGFDHVTRVLVMK
jgi:hypothetical protein